ncbi:MAG: hypothetical protein ACLGJB_06555 [Blastocatellia bacterium]
MNRPNVELYIEELVLHGFVPGERHDIGEAVERELTRLFAEQGAPPQLSHSSQTARMDAGAFEVSPDSKPEVIGTQVAQTLYGRLGR